jgi:lactate 2-monooxygenase
MPNYGDWQMDIYLRGLQGEVPALPMTFADLERQAELALTPEMWSYVSGGSGDETTQRVNVQAFDRWGLMPRMLAGAANRDLSIELFGTRLPSPVMLAPVGVIALCEPAGHGDLTTAAAAARTGVPMIASTLAEDSLESVAASLGETPGWFQLYPPNNWDVTASLIGRAETAGFEAIVLTVDTLSLGWRPRDLALASMPQLKGLCLANYFTDPAFRSLLQRSPAEDPQAALGLWTQMFGHQHLDWDGLRRIRDLTHIPLVVKGITHPDDARRALDAGADGLYCSNHGGRQANGGLPALDCLPDVVDVAGDAPVIFDSGVRSGVHIIKALALGARAVAIGRPYAYGLAVGGAAGIEHVLRCLLAETDLTLGLDGYASIAELTRECLRPTPIGPALHQPSTQGSPA